MNLISDLLIELLSEFRYNITDKKIVANLAERFVNLIDKMKADGQIDKIEPKVLEHFLTITLKPEFLTALPNDNVRNQWAELCFEIIKKIDFRLKDLMQAKVNEHPDKVLFQDMSGEKPDYYSYNYVNRYASEIAAYLYYLEAKPKVAIFSDNTVETAVCDLACMFYDIIVTPISVHFDSEILEYIFALLNINIVITNSEDKCKRLLQLKKSSNLNFHIIVTDENINIDDSKVKFLRQEVKRISPATGLEILNSRSKLLINEVSTVMFTSGSTGKPKGVSFSNYNIITKRFARGAALPHIGINEVMLCYLPLFHTFGRYLEMTGSIYWSGTYTFTGNPSAETLLSLFPKVNPSIFISIPLRWVQLYERIMERSSTTNTEYQLRDIVGHRLKWGLSAAGYLDPQVFKFFERNGVSLCSGFGMTEATGGITMTPPQSYKERSNGKALPGIYLRQNETGELEMRGHYTARYYEDANLGQVIPIPENDDKDRWLKTGDIFQKSPDGYYEIIDRLKDIYKNNKGQTIAPLRVENKFLGVPGIKRTFLVGDGRAYNVLFIIPDFADQFLSKTTVNIQEYFHQLVTAANKDLANYERVVNFTVLDRDFSNENGELTPKGTFNRKIIETNFKEEINKSYLSDFIDFHFKSFVVRIPRWFYRDLGILEDDIIKTDSGLYNKNLDKNLNISRYFTKNNYVIGNLEYCINDNIIDLGLIARQPKLWAANPQFICFAPCKDGWDIPLTNISSQVYLPWNYYNIPVLENYDNLTTLKDKNLIELNKLLTCALFCKDETQIQAINQASEFLGKSEFKVTELIRRRLEVLARHPIEEIRCLAYRLLLLDEPKQNYASAFPAFIESGLSFLNSDSINYIATEKLEKRRLEALRIRLFEYRKQLHWPANFQTRQQFVNVFRLLMNFVIHNQDYYNSVRTELCAWILHKEDPDLSKIALEYFKELSNRYEAKLLENFPNPPYFEWDKKFIFDDSLSDYDIQMVRSILYKTTFLKQSVMLAFDEKDFDINTVPEEGIWVSKIKTVGRNGFYRISILTNIKKHYDLQLITGEDLKLYQSNQTIYWLFSIAGFPYGNRVLPNIGCCRPELSARSMAYNGNLTFWERIRELSEESREGRHLRNPNVLRKLFTIAITTFFRAWRNSNFRIIPGIVSGDNVVVPQLDFIEGAMILSISGWKPYVNSYSLIKPLIKNFFQKTIYHYPWTRSQLNLNWLFDACMEALGEKDAFNFFQEMMHDLETEPFYCLNGVNLKQLLQQYMNEYRKNFYLPMSVLNAIERYQDWHKENINPSVKACEETIDELRRLYKIDTYHEYVRYTLYRLTVFEQFNENIKTAFDKFLKVFSANREKPAVQIIELSDVQNELENDEQRDLLSKIVFPKIHRSKQFEIEKVGSLEKSDLIIKTYINDNLNNEYYVREPLMPAEIGHLYRLFYKQNITINITILDKYFIAFDSNEKIIGGICYRVLDDKIVFFDNVIVDNPYKNRGIAAALIDDFCTRMENINIEVIKTHYYLENFFKKFGFKIDNNWGTLVKFLK